MSFVARHALLYTLSNIAVAGVSLLLMPVLTRLLGPAEYGMLAVFTSVQAGLATIVGLTAHAAASRRWADGDREAMPGYVAAAAMVVLASALVMLFAVLLVPDALLERLVIPRTWLLAAWLAVTASSVLALRMSLWQIQANAVRYALMQFGIALANAGLTLWLVLGGAGADGRVSAVVVVSVLAAVVAVVSLLRDGLLAFRVQRRDVHDVLAFGVPLLPHMIGLYLLASTDRALVAGMAGIEAAGFYFVALQVASVIGMLGDAANRAWTPWLYAQLGSADEATRRRVVRTTWLAFSAALLLALGISLAAGWLVPLLAGPGYADAVPVVGWLALQQAFLCMYLGVTNYVFFARRTGALSLVTIVSGLCGVLLMLWLVPVHGIIGAAVAAAGAAALRFVLTFMLAARCVPMPWWSALHVAPEMTR